MTRKKDFQFILLPVYLTTIFALTLASPSPQPQPDSSIHGLNAHIITGGSFNPSTQSPAINQLPLWEANQTHSSSSPSRATTLSGVPYPSLTASQAIGTRGHLLFQDFFLIDKLASFVRERIPERVVHAKGAGAHGYFQVTSDISSYTKANFLNGIGKKTEVFVRFSTVGGELGSPETWVDPHGFAVKFYTEDGNHDLVGNNIESFPIRDPMLFPDLNKSRKRNPVTNKNDLNMWWDFTSLRPEATLHALHLHSDIGRPDGFRRADGFGVHAFKLVNAKGLVTFAKFHWRSRQRAPALTVEQAKELAGSNPEYKTQDLYDAIARKEYPSWDFFIQVMSPEQARKYERNPFDITRTWREEDFPLIPVGRMTLNRNPENYFAEVEQVAFAPSNMVPGIEPSPDRMLAGRLFSYQDAQRYRLGVNGQKLEINRPRFNIVASYNRNGAMCYGRNGGGSPNYYPNSFGGVGEGKEEEVGQVNFRVEGVVDRYDREEDEWLEARLFLERDVNPVKGHRRRLVEALADRIKETEEGVRERTLRNLFYPVEEKFGEEIREEIERQLRSQGKRQGQGQGQNRDGRGNFWREDEWEGQGQGQRGQGQLRRPDLNFRG